MIILGIDPGLNGAIAEYDTEDGHVIIHDMPTMEVTRNGRKKREVNAQLLSQVQELPLEQ